MEGKSCSWWEQHSVEGKKPHRAPGALRPQLRKPKKALLPPAPSRVGRGGREAGGGEVRQLMAHLVSSCQGPLKDLELSRTQRGGVRSEHLMERKAPDSGSW